MLVFTELLTLIHVLWHFTYLCEGLQVRLEIWDAPVFPVKTQAPIRAITNIFNPEKTHKHTRVNRALHRNIRLTHPSLISTPVSLWMDEDIWSVFSGSWFIKNTTVPSTLRWAEGRGGWEGTTDELRGRRRQGEEEITKKTLQASHSSPLTSFIHLGQFQITINLADGCWRNHVINCNISC